jgi:hypothetical protein
MRREAGKHKVLTLRQEFCEHFNDPAVYMARIMEMDRRQRAELDRRLAQARRLSLEPSDPLTRERLAQLIEDLEQQLQDQRKVA